MNGKTEGGKMPDPVSVYNGLGGVGYVSMLRLFNHNPWWTDAARIQDEPEILAWAESGFRRGPLDEISFMPDDAVYSLRGPRQVGKTTLLKLEIKRLLEEGVAGPNVLYCSFESEDSPRDVADMLDAYLAWSGPGNGERRFLFLDELSDVFHWQRAIKSLKDADKLTNCTVVTTGSHSVDLRRATELLPGRRGSPSDNLDKILLPMSFGRYVEAVDKSLGSVVRKGALATREGRASVIRGLARGEIASEIADAALMHAKLAVHLDRYLATGGMPLAVLDFVTHRSVTDRAYVTYLDAAEGIIGLAGKSKHKADQLASNIWRSSGSPVSWSSLRRGTSIGSYHTVEEYSNTLEDMFVVSTMYRYDSETNRPKFDSSKKIYFRDPLFVHALEWQIESDTFEQSLHAVGNRETKSKLVEQAVADHALRMSQALSPRRSRTDQHYSVMYWRSAKSGREVDFVVRDGGSLVPVEVKYQTKVRRDDTWGLTDFAKATGNKGGIVVTRDEIGKFGPVSLVPAAVFLLLA